MLWLAMGAVARGEIQPEFAMDSDPELKRPEPIEVFPLKHRPLWFQALARPEADLQHRAADAIADAHRIGTPGLDEAKPILQKIVAAENTNPTARLAVARALVVLDARESADTLFAASQKFGTDLRQLVEPALAKWKHQPIRKVWQQRLDDPESRHRDLLLAIHGMGTVGEGSAVPALLLIVHEPLRPMAARLAASRAAGQIQNSGLEPDAEKLVRAKSPSLQNRLYAVSLLGQHRSSAAQTLLLRLAHDEEPAIAAVALATLNAIDPQLVLPLAEQVFGNRDANVRRQGVATYVALATPERVVRLTRLLDDPHPGVRSQVRERLFVLAKSAELHAPILNGASDVLGGDSWRGHEQAALLLAALDHKPAASRLVQLLDSPRGEVMVATGWALRKLAVRDTLPAILAKVERQTTIRMTNALDPPGDAQVAHLCEALGLMKYEPADSLLRTYIPKNFSMGELSRGGAIWALGHIHAGKPDEPLAELITGRLTEPPMTPSEMARVRHACAISLGRMKAKSQVAPMRKFLGPKVGLDPVSMSIRWAIHEITGELLPGPDPYRFTSRSNWFLEPIE